MMCIQEMKRQILTLKIFFLLSFLEGLISFLYLLTIPGDPKNSFLLGLSTSRLFLLGVVLILALFFFSALIIIWRQENLANKLTSRLENIFNRPVVLLIATHLSFLVSLFGLYIFYLSFFFGTDRYIEAYAIRLRPLVFWVTAICIKILIILLLQTFWFKNNKIFVTLAIIVFTSIVLKTAWISDDAYITFRTIENFRAGYGMVFNVGERVQTFTHPLWLFLITGVYLIASKIEIINVWAQLYYIVISISIGISILTVEIFANKVSRSTRMSILGVMVLTLSKAFIDYSTSGLENPLTHILIMVFFLIYLNYSKEGDRKLLLLSLVASLGVLNRLDTILIYSPVIFYLLMLKKKRRIALLNVGIGFLPLIIWEIFSTFYYGFPFPNTGYAKLNTGISKIDLMQQAIHYYTNSLLLDPITLIVVFSAIALVLILKHKHLIPIVIGLVLYLIYILYIGGDFMSGRYFSAPLMVAIILIAQNQITSNRTYGILFLLILFFGLLSPMSPLRGPLNFGAGVDFRTHIDDNKIADERAVYYPRLGLFRQGRVLAIPGSPYAGKNWIYQNEPIEVELIGALGTFAYLVGPNVHVIDLNGLADPFMARLPVEDIHSWRIGHFRHLIPDGYLETLSSDENLIQEPNLSQYYDKLSLVVRGDLWNWNRIIEIINFNIGRNQNLIDEFIETLP